VDADAVIEQAAGCSIPEIFERDGEAGFRALESQVLNAIGQRHSLVVATGGGVVTQQENWGLLHSGIVVWLDVVPEQLMQRLRADSTVRPLLQTDDPDAALNTLLNQRRPISPWSSTKKRPTPSPKGSCNCCPACCKIRPSAEPTELKPLAAPSAPQTTATSSLG
jgi:shikimate kinase